MTNAKKIVFIAAVLSAAAVTVASTNGAGVAKTMVVRRCQAVRNGLQCVDPAQTGSDYCWKHRGLARVVGEASESAAEGVRSAWNSARGGATNAWAATRSGATNVWKRTKAAADGARVGLIEMLGGTDGKKE